jgi:hypothetical protein
MTRPVMRVQVLVAWVVDTVDTRISISEVRLRTKGKNVEQLLQCEDGFLVAQAILLRQRRRGLLVITINHIHMGAFDQSASNQMER